MSLQEKHTFDFEVNQQQIPWLYARGFVVAYGQLRELIGFIGCCALWVETRLVQDCTRDDNQQNEEDQDRSNTVVSAASCAGYRVVVVRTARNVCRVVHRVISFFLKVQYPMCISTVCIGRSKNCTFAHFLFFPEPNEPSRGAWPCLARHLSP